MFDVGFWELCMVGLVSLLVIGPERLPKAARIAGFWLGKTRNMVAAVKAEIKEELRAEELRQVLKEQAALEDFHKAVDDAKQVAQDLKSSIEASPEQHEQVKRPNESE
ncbi:MAG: Sec-independent protein translocase protein TatB [Gammaproteobacteria bacterium]